MAELLKIGELAKATGTNVSTLKFYVKEGLINIEKKTSRNMAYYHSNCIKRVMLIKQLQKEKYYPLSMIKHILDSGVPSNSEIELYDAIHKVSRNTSSRTISISEAVKETGLSRRQVEVLIEKRIISPVITGGKKAFLDSDCRIMKLIKRRQKNGLPFDETIKSFLAYQENLMQAATVDINAILSGAIVPDSPSTSEIVNMIRVSDETLDEFVQLKRYEINCNLGAKHIEEMCLLSSNLEKYLTSICDAFRYIGDTYFSELCRKALAQDISELNSISKDALKQYQSIILNTHESLAKSVSACNKTNKFFIKLDSEKSTGNESLLLHALKVGWNVFTPEILISPEEKTHAKSCFKKYTILEGEKAIAFYEKLPKEVKSSGK